MHIKEATLYNQLTSIALQIMISLSLMAFQLISTQAETLTRHDYAWKIIIWASTFQNIFWFNLVRPM
ncbi:MAG: hypothetical protein AAF702_17445 [Chloroflexota bacterium]